MGIIDCANTPEELGLPSSAGTTSATGRDNAYVPNGLLLLTEQQMTWNLPAYTGEFWLHFKFRLTGGVATAAGTPNHFAIFDANNSELCRMMKSATGAAWRIRVFGDTTVTATNTITYAGSVDYTFDVKVVVIAANITVEVYSNGTLVSNATAANTTSGKGVPRRVDWNNTDLISSGDIRYNEIFAMNDESTINRRLSLRTPNTLGNYSQWSGAIGDLTDSDPNTVIQADANGERFSYNPTAYGGPASPAAVRGVMVKSLARRISGTPSKLNHFLRISGVDYEGTGLTVPLGDHVRHVWDNNPSTGLAWTGAQLSTFEAGLKAET